MWWSLGGSCGRRHRHLSDDIRGKRLAHRRRPGGSGRFFRDGRGAPAQSRPGVGRWVVLVPACGAGCGRSSARDPLRKGLEERGARSGQVGGAPSWSSIQGPLVCGLLCPDCQVPNGVSGAVHAPARLESWVVLHLRLYDVSNRSDGVREVLRSRFVTSGIRGLSGVYAGPVCTGRQ